MKKVLVAVLCVALILSTVVFAAGNKVEGLIMDLKVMFNNKETSVKNPIVINNSTYVPLRDMARLTGKFVYWDPETKGIFMLEDGKYIAYEIGKHGWIQQIDVTIDSGDITAVVYNEYKTKGKSTDKDGYIKTMYDAKKVDLAAAMDSIEQQLLEKQDVSKVDSISGATSMSTSFKALAVKALESAKDAATGKLKDGLYDPTGEANYGYFPMIELTIKDGKIATVNYDEYPVAINSKTIDHVKPDDKAYVDSFKTVKNLPNLDLAKMYKAWAKNFEEKDAPDKMTLDAKADTVAGATHSFDEFKVLARKALMTSRIYADGTYKAEQPNLGATGWRYTLEFVVKSGKITSVKFDALDKNGVLKTDPKTDYSAYTKAFGITIGEQYKKLQDALLTAQTPTAVDKVAGATHSWAEFKALVNEALEKGPVPAAK